MRTEEEEDDGAVFCRAPELMKHYVYTTTMYSPNKAHKQLNIKAL